MTHERNGIDLSLDSYDAATIERIEIANKRYLENRRPLPDTATSTAQIVHSCQQVMAAIDEIYSPIHGPGISLRLYNMNALNYREVMDDYRRAVDTIMESTESMLQYRIEQEREKRARFANMAAMKAEIAKLEQENKETEVAWQAEADTRKEALAASQAQQHACDTSRPVSDMSQMPKVPLAVPSAPTVPDNYATSVPYSPTTAYPPVNE